MKKQIRKGKSIAMTMAAMMAAAAVTTGCGGSAGSEASAMAEDGSGQTELTMLWGSSESEEYNTYIKNVIADFEEQNPDIKINISFVSDPEGQIRQQMAAGGGPDLVNTDPTSMHVLASSGYLVSLDDYAKEYNWGERFDQWVVDSLSSDGSWYGLPGMMDGMLVYYNKDLFEENNWEIPTNWDELYSLCGEISEQGLIPFSFGNSGYKQANQWWTSEAYCAGMGQDDLHALLTGEMPWTSEVSKDTAAKLADLWGNNYIYRDASAITLDDARTMFGTGMSAMHMSGTWDAVELIAMEPDFEWDVFEMPAWRDGVSPVLPVALGGSFSINAKCANPDAAAKFLDYMYQPEVAAGMIEFGTLYPEKGIDISGQKVHEKIKMVQDYVDEALESGNIGYCAWTYWPANTDTYAWNNIESLAMGQISVDEYCENLQKNFELDQEKGNVLDF